QRNADRTPIEPYIPLPGSPEFPLLSSRRRAYPNRPLPGSTTAFGCVNVGHRERRDRMSQNLPAVGALGLLRTTPFSFPPHGPYRECRGFRGRLAFQKTNKGLHGCIALRSVGQASARRAASTRLSVMLGCQHTITARSAAGISACMNAAATIMISVAPGPAT